MILKRTRIKTTDVFSGSCTARIDTLSSRILNSLYRDKYLWLLILPGLVWYLIFVYGPMYGFVIAFENYNPSRGILGGPWVGIKWFEQFFSSNNFWRLIKNTLLLNVYSIIFGFPAPILLALLINDINARLFKKVVQTASYMPHFISSVIIVGMAVNFLSPSAGIINHFIKAMGIEPIYFLVRPEWFRPVYLATSIWQETGWKSIIFLAAISNVNVELYDSAVVDGANKIRRLIHITLPAIMPTIIIMLLLNLGHMLNIGYEKIILLYNSSTYETSDVINTYVYRRGIVGGEYSFGTAVGLFQSFISFLLLLGFNKLSRKISEIGLW